MRTLKQIEAEAIARNRRTNDGRVFFDLLVEQYDLAMRNFLYAKPEELATKQGAAQAYNEMMDVYSNADKALSK